MTMERRDKMIQEQPSNPSPLLIILFVHLFPLLLMIITILPFSSSSSSISVSSSLRLSFHPPPSSLPRHHPNHSLFHPPPPPFPPSLPLPHHLSPPWDCAFRLAGSHSTLRHETKTHIRNEGKDTFFSSWFSCTLPSPLLSCQSLLPSSILFFSFVNVVVDVVVVDDDDVVD